MKCAKVVGKAPSPRPYVFVTLVHPLPKLVIVNSKSLGTKKAINITTGTQTLLPPRLPKTLSVETVAVIVAAAVVRPAWASAAKLQSSAGTTRLGNVIAAVPAAAAIGEMGSLSSMGLSMGTTAERKGPSPLLPLGTQTLSPSKLQLKTLSLNTVAVDAAATVRPALASAGKMLPSAGTSQQGVVIAAGVPAAVAMGSRSSIGSPIGNSSEQKSHHHDCHLVHRLHYHPY